MKAMFERTYTYGQRKLTFYTNGADFKDCMCNLFCLENQLDVKLETLPLVLLKMVAGDVAEHLNTSPDIDPDDFLPDDN